MAKISSPDHPLTYLLMYSLPVSVNLFLSLTELPLMVAISLSLSNTAGMVSLGSHSILTCIVLRQQHLPVLCETSLISCSCWHPGQLVFLLSEQTLFVEWICWSKHYSLSGSAAFSYQTKISFFGSLSLDVLYSTTWRERANERLSERVSWWLNEWVNE